MSTSTHSPAAPALACYIASSDEPNEAGKPDTHELLQRLIATRYPNVGIEDSGVALGVARLLSRYICTSRDEAGTHVFQLNALLYGYAHEKGHAGGEQHGRPHPNLIKEKARGGRAALTALDCSFDDLNRLWQDMRDLLGRDQGYLPFAVICEFVPATLWPVVATFVHDGPLLAKDRAENHLRNYGRVTARLDKSSVGVPGARLSTITIIARQAAVKKLMRHTVELRPVEPTLLAAWDAVPTDWEPVEDLPRNRRDNSAVPAHTTRAVWKRCCTAVADKLKVSPFDFDAEWEAVERLTPAQLYSGGHFRLWRRRLAFMLQAGLACRKGAALRLTRADYDPRRPRRDGTVGPAVRLYERKKRGRYEEAWKPVAAEFGALIELHVFFFDRYLTKVSGLASVPSDLPLLSGVRGERLKDGTAYGASSFTVLFSGGSQTRQCAAVRAMVPREGAPEHAGHPPHHLRSTGRMFLTSKDAQRWYKERGIDINPEWIAETLLGHADEDVERLYGGASKPEDREHLSAFATALLWRLVTTDLGARRQLDSDKYRDAARALRAHHGEIERLELETVQLAETKRALRERRAAARERDPVRAVELQDRLDITEDRGHEVRDQLTRLHRLAAEVREDMRELRESPQRQTIVDDELPTAEYRGVDPAELDEIDREVFEGVTTRRRGQQQQRAYLSPVELAGLDGRSVDFFKNLLAGTWPKNMRGVEPWKRGAHVLADWSTPKRRGLVVEMLNPELPMFHNADTRQLLDELLATPYPEGWGSEWLDKAFPVARRLLGGPQGAD